MTDVLDTAALGPRAGVGGYRRVWIDETVDVAARVEDVRAWLADVNAWPERFPGFRGVRRIGRGPTRRGTFFTMVITLGPVSWLWLPSRVSVWSEDALQWGGGIPGARIRHGFVLTSVGPDRTAVRHYEYATGALALLCRSFESAIYDHDAAWLRAIEAHFAA